MTLRKHISRIVWLAAVILSIAVSSYAAADYYLKIEGVKGEKSSVVHCVSGLCAANDLAPGSYSAVVCDAAGNPVTSGDYKLDVAFRAVRLRESPTKSSLRESPSKASTGKTSIAEDATASARIVAPRDAASGLPTGRRQHEPVRFIKQWGAKSAAPVKVDTPTGGGNDDVAAWALEVRVDRIEMK